MSILTDPWNFYIGSVWAQLLLNHDLPRSAAVVEIGPGFADKIGLALAARHFEGTLYVVEPNDAARRWVVERYRELLHGAEIVPVSKPVLTVRDCLPNHVEGLLMNHVLDDMLLGAALAPIKCDYIFGELDRARVLPTVKAAWQGLIADQAKLQTLSKQIIEEVGRLLEKIDPRVFGVSQYTSWFLSKNGLESVDRLGVELLQQLGERVGQTADRDRATLQYHEQDPDRWLFLERHSASTEVG